MLYYNNTFYHSVKSFCVRNRTNVYDLRFPNFAVIRSSFGHIHHELSRCTTNGRDSTVCILCVVHIARDYKREHVFVLCASKVWRRIFERIKGSVRNYDYYVFVLRSGF